MKISQYEVHEKGDVGIIHISTCVHLYPWQTSQQLFVINTQISKNKSSYYVYLGNVFILSTSAQF